MLSEPPPLSLEIVEISPIICAGAANGIVELLVEGGIPPYVYQFNNQQIGSTLIEQLGVGTYSVLASDANECLAATNLQLQEPAPMVIDAFTSPVSCYGDTDGEINLSIKGGQPNYRITWNDARYNGETTMTKMAAGSYTATITDDLGCQKEETVTIFQPPFNKDCGTFIPNVFSPNGDGNNDVFYVVESNNGIAVEKMNIYNRWGELVFQNSNNCQDIGNQTCGWAGLINGNIAPAGTYIYLISIRFAGMPEPVLFTGDVQLLK